MSDPAAVAREAAGHVDRLVITMHRLAAPLLRRTVALPAGGTGVLVDLSRPLLTGPAAVGDLHAVIRYMPWQQFVAALDTHVGQGLVERLPDGRYGLTDSGHRFCAAIEAAQAAAVGEQWGTADGLVTRLLPLAHRLVAAAWETAGTAFAVVAGARDPRPAEPAHLLMVRLTALRYHRADAHAAACAAAGLTAEEVVALPDGPERDRIEVDTNRRAGSVYGALAAAERVAWLDGLAALPG